MARTPEQSARNHIVFIPGFGGFDALGQLEYYAGITGLFRSWLDQNKPDRHTAVHYFDNLPTAGVTTRAQRLCRYLAKRRTRGEFGPDDAIILVGHSTGGLDIRRALLELDRMARQHQPFAVDGDEQNAIRLSASNLLRRIKGVVFLSVPQRGTNIADWVYSQDVLRRLFLQQVRTLVATADASTLANRLQALTSGLLGRASDADLFHAVADTIREIDAPAVRDDPSAMAAANEAAAKLRLWLTHINADFNAIFDLTTQPMKPPPDGDESQISPAHFSEQARAAEIAMWASYGIKTRSYATIGRNPYRFSDADQVPVLGLKTFWREPFVALRDDARAWAGILYLACYRACAGGAFRIPATEPATATDLDGRTSRKIHSWDNDGIVNTGSMLWPGGHSTRLVEADHGDIIGHYRLTPVAQKPGDDRPRLRRYHTYDLLKSGTNFGSEMMQTVWFEVFDFCTEVAQVREGKAKRGVPA